MFAWNSGLEDLGVFLGSDLVQIDGALRKRLLVEHGWLLGIPCLAAGRVRREAGIVDLEVGVTGMLLRVLLTC